MWQYKKVEQALFRWDKWRQSIVGGWITPGDLKELPLSQLKLRVREELNKLNLPGSLWFELYWICCVSSEYNFDYETSFKKILVPDWLPLPYEPSLYDYEIRSRTRMYPPDIWDEGDIQFSAKQRGLWGIKFYDENGRIEEVDRSLLYPKNFELRIFLPSDHELYRVLNRLQGRPKNVNKIGKYPLYSDRLAVQCAVLCDRDAMTYVKIAERFGLPVTKPIFSSQSNHVIHLIRRGRKLINDLGENIPE
jgi:hypothetical protein